MPPSVLEEFGRPAWEFAWAYTGRADAAVACLARALAFLNGNRLPAQEPARRRAFWKALADACRLQANASPPGSPASGDPRLARLLDLPLELREALLLLRYQAASAEDLGVILDCPAGTAVERASRGLSRVALARSLPAP